MRVSSSLGDLDEEHLVELKGERWKSSLRVEDKTTWSSLGLSGEV